MAHPDRLGKYLIRRELGRGAMGVVYEGFDPLIERTVAVKVLQIDAAHVEHAAELRERFRREAQAAGRLGHPHIVSVYDYGEAADTHDAFIAMELVKGRDLKSLFDAGTRFSLREAGRIMSGLLGALQHAHERGVVHRDIKPGNLILLDDGSVKVADFGIARIDSSELTQVGSVLGTMSHMSPEQLSGEPVDGRSDLFSAGVILYQLLTGVRPFSGSPATLMQQMLHEEPKTPSRVVPALSATIDAVVRKAMAKTPGARYQTADAFAAALRSALAGDADPEATLVRPAGVPSRTPASRARLAAVWGVAGLVAAGGAWLLLKPGEATAPPPKLDIAVAPPAVAPAAPPAPVAASAPAPAPSAPPPVVIPSADAIEQQAWDDALKANRMAGFQAYLKAYPEGRFAGRARIRMAALEPRPVVPPPATVAAASSPASVAGRGRPASAPAPLALASAPAPRPTPRPPPAPPPVVESKKASKDPIECADPARRGNARCQVAMGHLHRLGKDVPRDFAQALRWYRMAAEQGSDVAQFELGAMYESGSGVPKDYKEAVAWYRKAAEQGHARAQNRVGVSYENGAGQPANLVLAADWYRKAADQGLGNAQANLGRFYLLGRGVFKDLDKAAELLQKAVVQGDPNAMFHLASMYRKGEGRPRDAQKAAQLYRDALAHPSLNERNREAARAFLANKLQS